MCEINNSTYSVARYFQSLPCLGRIAGWLAVVFWSAAAPAAPPVAVLTYHNDNARTGANNNETVLNLNNVNPASFGLLSLRSVDDWVYAQPLVMTNVNLPGKGTHNLVIVATVNDSVYAFDADNPSISTPYWHTSFLGPDVVAVRNTDMTGACGGGYVDFHGNMGIVGTPVIDPASYTLYVVAKTKENATNFVQRLHALDLATGNERSNSPVILTAAYPGTGDGGTVIQFDPMKQNQRPALTLVNGIVYIGWASHCDWGPYHGWLLGYNAQTLVLTTSFVTTPNGYFGGIWSSGNGPAVDDLGNLYLETGNGDFDPANNDYGDSFLRLSTTSGLALSDYFTPYNQDTMDGWDLDLGSAGAIVLPDEVGSTEHPHLLVGGSKMGTIYLLDRDDLGHFNQASDSQIVQSIPNGTSQCFDTPAYFNHRLYMAGTDDPLKLFNISDGHINPTPASQSPTTFGFTAPTASVSANGGQDAIVWALQVDRWGAGLPAVLRAYNATNLAQELYNSNKAGNRDHPVGAVKSSVPTVANGKVFVGGQFAFATFGNLTSFITGSFTSNRFQVQVSGLAGNTYILQGSTNLLDWLALCTNVASANNFTLFDTSTTNSPYRFYRVLRSP